MTYIHKWQKKEHSGAVWKVRAKPVNFWVEWENDETAVLCHTAGDNSRKTKHHNSKCHLKRHSNAVQNFGKVTKDICQIWGKEVKHYIITGAWTLIFYHAGVHSLEPSFYGWESRNGDGGRGGRQPWKGFYYQKKIYLPTPYFKRNKLKVSLCCKSAAVQNSPGINRGLFTMGGKPAPSFPKLLLLNC